MAGSHHTGRRSWRPSTVRGRNLSSMLDGRRQAEADLRRVLYVRPYGYGFHVVKNLCNDEEYVVADGLGFKRTFAPGTVVMLGSQTGHPGEMLISGPPSGMGGASAFPVSAAVRSGYGPVPPTLEPEPVYTAGSAAFWFDSGTLYAAWAASDEDSNFYLQIGEVEPEYIEEEPAANEVGTDDLAAAGAATLLYTIADAEFSPGYVDTKPLAFAVLDGYALVQTDPASLSVVDMSDGSVVAVNGAISFAAPATHREWDAVVVGSKLVLHVDGNLYSYDWPALTNEATAAAPTKANTKALGIGPHADGIAFFLAGNGVLGREKVYRWTFDSDLTQVQGETLYSLTGGREVMVKATHVIPSGTSYQIPTAFTGPTYGLVELNAAHNAQSDVITSLWTSTNVPARSFETTPPAGVPVAGTAADPSYASIAHLISDGVVAYAEIVEPALPDV